MYTAFLGGGSMRYRKMYVVGTRSSTNGKCRQIWVARFYSN